jgi:hypothetical protein
MVEPRDHRPELPAVAAAGAARAAAQRPAHQPDPLGEPDQPGTRPGQVDGHAAGRRVVDGDGHLAAAAAAAARGPYSWDSIGSRTFHLYRELLSR